MESYLGVMCHFLSLEWIFASHILQTHKIEKSHTAATIACELDAVSREWNIEEKVAACTYIQLTDNARNIVGGVHQPAWQHIPCSAHTQHQCHRCIEDSCCIRLAQQVLGNLWGTLNIVALFRLPLKPSRKNTTCPNALSAVLLSSKKI